jgi:hypothetical protein
MYSWKLLAYLLLSQCPKGPLGFLLPRTRELVHLYGLAISSDDFLRWREEQGNERTDGGNSSQWKVRDYESSLESLCHYVKNPCLTWCDLARLVRADIEG